MVAGPTLPLLIANATVDQVMRSMFDDTFAGIHQLAWLDWAILIPYYTLLLILSIYGLHRYAVIRTYRKWRRNTIIEPAARFESLPPVTIQLPIYNERFVIERLLEEVVKMDYPVHLLQIQVLDDSTDETHAFTERLVGAYRAQGIPIEYHHRSNRLGFKAGALEAGSKTATGELIAIFDADFVPPRDFLQRTVHFFTDPKIGVVQTRWTYLNRHFNLLTEVQAMLLDGHFVLEHEARCGRGLFFNFNGTAGVLRKSMIEDAGGWQHDTLTEDTDLSYRAQLKGWRFLYLPDVECPSELPVETHSFQVQQSRWAKGLMQVGIKLLPSILRAKLPWRVKMEAFCHLTPNISYPLMLAVSALTLPVSIVRFYMGWYQMLILDLPLVVANFLSLMLFYAYAQRELDPRGWKRSLPLLPVLMAAGVAITVSNAKAVLEALLGIRSGFVRTAKYAITGEGRATPPASRYRRRSGWLPWVELAVGCWFVYVIAYSIECYNFFAIPFLLLFVCGYWWAGFTTMYQEYRGRLAWERERGLGVETVR